MTQFSDQLGQGRAYFARFANWNGTTGNNGMPSATSSYDTQVLGVPHTQTFCYQIGAASTVLSSGVFFSASGATAAGTLTLTGSLVSAGVATFDVPRCVRFTSSVDLSTNVFTVRGTDGYGQSLTVTVLGPTGNTFGAAGSFRDSNSAFKTVTTASAVGGSSTTAFGIGTADVFGLPFRINAAGLGQGVFIDGNTATIPAAFTAGFTATGTPTATTADVRGTVALSTLVPPNGTRYFVANFIQAPVNLTQSSDIKERSFGTTPFSS